MNPGSRRAFPLGVSGSPVGARSEAGAAQSLRKVGSGILGVAQKPEAGGAAPLLESCICMTMSPLSPSQANNIIPGL